MDQLVDVATLLSVITLVGLVLTGLFGGLKKAFERINDVARDHADFRAHVAETYASKASTDAVVTKICGEIGSLRETLQSIARDLNQLLGKHQRDGDD